MKLPGSTARLLVLCGAACLALAAARTLLIREAERADAPAMKQAVRCTQKWFSLVDTLKSRGGIPPTLPPTIPYRAMIGSEWSEITTTLGSLEAKRTAANPQFAALLVRMLHEAGVDSTGRVAVVLSGSFPSLAIATLAAVQTIGARAIVLSSLGASSYGANEPGATWLDMENYLAEYGGLRFRSAVVTPGAEDDRGEGMSEEGLRVLAGTARRCGTTLTIPASLREAITMKMDLLTREPVNVLVNIGGNHTSLGGCVHAPAIPHGYHAVLPRCDDPDRGIIERMNERGIPVIHLLNVKALAAEYGLPIEPGSTDPVSGIYNTRTLARLPVAVLLAGIFGAAILLRRGQE